MFAFRGERKDFEWVWTQATTSATATIPKDSFPFEIVVCVWHAVNDAIVCGLVWMCVLVGIHWIDIQCTVHPASVYFSIWNIVLNEFATWLQAFYMWFFPYSLHRISIWIYINISVCVCKCTWHFERDACVCLCISFAIWNETHQKYEISSWDTKYQAFVLTQTQ